MLWIVFDLDTPISLLLVICLLVLLFAVSVVGCLLGYSSCLVVWIPLFLDPSDGAFGRFDLAALCGCRTLNFCLFVYVCLGLPKVFLLIGGVAFIVFGPIRWSVWSFRPSSPLRLPHLKSFVCLFVLHHIEWGDYSQCGSGSSSGQITRMIGRILLHFRPPTSTE